LLAELVKDLIKGDAAVWLCQEVPVGAAGPRLRIVPTAIVRILRPVQPTLFRIGGWLALDVAVSSFFEC
jgi:hypothetical protein